MKTLLVLSVLLLTGCLRGPMGPSGEPNESGFTVSGKFSRSYYVPDANPYSFPGYNSYDTVSLTQEILNKRDRVYPSLALISCPQSFLKITQISSFYDTATISANSTITTDVQIDDSVAMDGWHVKLIRIHAHTGFSPLPDTCSYALVFP